MPRAVPAPGRWIVQALGLSSGTISGDGLVGKWRRVIEVGGITKGTVTVVARYPNGSRRIFNCRPSFRCRSAGSETSDSRSLLSSGVNTSTPKITGSTSSAVAIKYSTLVNARSPTNSVPMPDVRRLVSRSDLRSITDFRFQSFTALIAVTPSGMAESVSARGSDPRPVRCAPASATVCPSGRNRRGQRPPLPI